MNDRAAGPVDDDVTHLNDMVCFNLYAASRAVAAAYRPLLEPLDVTYPQYLVLATLWEYGDLSVGELSIRLQLEYGTMTPLLKRMEARGLVSRTRSARDERTVIVALAPDGDAVGAVWRRRRRLQRVARVVLGDLRGGHDRPLRRDARRSP